MEFNYNLKKEIPKEILNILSIYILAFVFLKLIIYLFEDI